MLTNANIYEMAMLDAMEQYQSKSVNSKSEKSKVIEEPTTHKKLNTLNQVIQNVKKRRNYSKTSELEEVK